MSTVRLTRRGWFALLVLAILVGQLIGWSLPVVLPWAGVRL